MLITKKSDILTADEYLGQLKRLNKLIEQQAITIKELKASYNKSLSVFAFNHDKYKNSSDASSSIAKMLDEMAMYDKMIEENVNLRGKIIFQINNLPNKKFSFVLHAYYVNNFTVEMIAKELDVATKNAWFIKKRALKFFENTYEI